MRFKVQDTITGKYVLGLSQKSNKDTLWAILKPKLDKSCADFSVTQLNEESEIINPINIAIVLDYSGSMSPHSERLQGIADQFISKLKGNLFTRVNFNDLPIKVDPAPTMDPKLASTDDLSPNGGTALYGGIFEGIETLSKAKGNKVLVVFTDGFENSSGINMNAVFNNAKEKSVSIYAIGFDLGNYDMLDSLCSKTLGRYYAVNDLGTDIFDRLVGDLENHYILKLKCHNKLAYPIEVALDVTDGPAKKLIVKDVKSFKPFPEEAIYFSTFLFYENTVFIVPEQLKGFKKAIEAIAENLIANPQSKIVIEGHASPEGDSLKNLKLSRARADFIYWEVLNYLGKKYRKDPNNYDSIIARNRIDVKFFGEELPLFPETSLKNFENRRVEVKTQ